MSNTLEGIITEKLAKEIASKMEFDVDKMAKELQPRIEKEIIECMKVAVEEGDAVYYLVENTFLPEVLKAFKKDLKTFFKKK